MQIYTNVCGSQEAARPVIVGKTTVYVHSNIREIEVTDEASGKTSAEYVYDEIQYTRKEWEQILAEGHEDTANALCELDAGLEEVKDALCEIDEILEG